jgi:hypothetical protein
MDSVRFRQALGQLRRLGHEMRVVLFPERLEVEQLAKVPAPRRRKTDAQA